MNPDIPRLKSFLQSFTQFEDRLTGLHIGEEIGALSTLFSGMRSVERVLEPFRRLEAPKYNIFEILNIRHLEAKVHTPFLGHLLDPRQTHHQGALFLHSFLQQVAERPAWVAGLENIRIAEEQATGDGFIDLLIRGRVPSGEFGIVIENKIYAGDQEGQLERYHDYLINQLGLAPDRCLLIYLTPNGHRPAIPHSIAQDDYDQLRGAGRLLLKSYRKDIYKWLTTQKQQTSAPKVQYTLQQYLEIIKRL